MSRLLLFGLGCLGLALCLPVSAGVKGKEKEKEPEKPPPHVILRDEMLRDQQALQRLHSEWLLQVVKLKQQLGRQEGAAAKQDADGCAKLVSATLELPALYDEAIIRIKQSSLVALPSVKEVLKATKDVADALKKANAVLQKAPPEFFPEERALSAEQTIMIVALLDTEDLAGAMRRFDAMEKGGDPAVISAAREVVQKKRQTCQAMLDTLQSADSSKESKVPPALAKKISAPLKELLSDKGAFVSAESALVTTDKLDPDAPARARKELGALQTAFDPLRTACSRIVVVVRLRELENRQQGLHDRLKKHHDAMLGKLLEGID
jgi:hypothetical protein